MLRPSTAFSLVLVGVLAGAADVTAQTLDLQTEELLAASAGFDINERPRVLFAEDGTSQITWVRGSAFGSEGVFTVRALPGQPYGSAVMISPGLDGVRFGFGDGLTVQANGARVITSWEGTDFLNRPIWFALSSDAGATWEPAERADPGTNDERAYTAGTFFADGRVAQVWMEYEAGTGTPELYWRGQDGNGTFGPPSFPASASPEIPCDCCNPDQVVLHDGSVLVAYRNNENNQRKIYVAKSTDGGASFPSSVRLDTSGALFFGCPGEPPSMAVEGQDVVVIWKKAPGNPPQHHIYSSVSADGGETFGPQVLVDGGNGTGVFHPQVARRGNVVVAVWTGRDAVTSHAEIFVATSLDGGHSWGPEQAVTGDGINGGLGPASVAVSPSLDVEIAWKDFRDGTGKIYRRGGALNTTAAVAGPLEASRIVAAPNPFTGQTRIRLEGPSGVQARLTIHDLAGRRVTEMIGGSEFVWDGRDRAGRPVGPGVYFVRTETRGGAAALRLIHLR